MRAEGALGLLTPILPRLVHTEMWAGRWPAASANAREGLRLAREIGQHDLVAYQLVLLALIAAHRGEENECRSLAAQGHELASARRFTLVASLANWALALLELELGRTEAAFLRAREISTHTAGAFERRFGVPIVEGYGLSEGSCASTLNPPHGPRKPGTVGLPLSGQEVALFHADGTIGRDGVGEVVIKGPNVMRGYLNRPEDTARTVIDGWLHTGDVGRFDDDGYLVLVDRIKDMIIRGGENIYPKEIENVLYAHPDVVEAAVVGAPHAVYGEVPVAFVTLRPGSTATGDELRAHCAGSLARMKIPTRIDLVEALPKNPVGKIDKPALRKGL
jgi:acyl-CoA synthetase (AMP-forming)/AMP-acid ligase II